ncbi:hypothetical protein C2S53_005522 [Perilla frutescens var. hirtella]|uniref:Uncharacterized protein n=1 Tax=Perilla frutescens var. hirtella TaxID=608512 RepID=A0AAD4INX0_PERFH|nr:hypothetical protein C2S53_005522 [Perilla frutescens var. hirtella]
MKISVVRRKLIKPCTPTPQNLKNYKISYIDELAPSTNIGLLLFYPSKPETTTIITQKLQQSLEKILPQFYLLAGRYIKSDHTVDCSDHGAEFVEAEASDEVDFPDIINAGTTTEQLTDLLPRGSYEVDEVTDPLLSVQITEFRRGGVIIAISVSHRISDTASLVTFVAAWSNATNSGLKATITSSFHESQAFFPGRNWDNPYGGPSRVEDPGIVIKRLCFDAEAIKSMRSKLTMNEGKQGISKVLVVSALIAKALIRLDRAKHGRSRECFINHAVNMRGRTVPNLHKHACGNLILQSLSRCISAAETGEIGIQELVDLMSDAIGKSVSDCGEVVSLGSDGVDEFTLKPVVNALPRVLSGEAHVVWFSDWSKFGIYETDFGWGKPAQAGVAPLHGGATTLLMENRGGDGIEAWVHLHKDDMPLFEKDEEISLFTS